MDQAGSVRVFCCSSIYPENKTLLSLYSAIIFFLNQSRHLSFKNYNHYKTFKDLDKKSSKMPNHPSFSYMTTYCQNCKSTPSYLLECCIHLWRIYIDNIIEVIHRACTNTVTRSTFQRFVWYFVHYVSSVCSLSYTGDSHYRLMFRLFYTGFPGKICNAVKVFVNHWRLESALSHLRAACGFVPVPLKGVILTIREAAS